MTDQGSSVQTARFLKRFCACHCMGYGLFQICPRNGIFCGTPHLVIQRILNTFQRALEFDNWRFHPPER